MNTAYLLFQLKGWEPKRYYDMSYGERLVARSFLHQELSERKKDGGTKQGQKRLRQSLS